MLDIFGTQSDYLPNPKLDVSILTTPNTRWGFFSAKYRNIAPLGFLIYQLVKPYETWDDLEYLGETTNEIRYINGLWEPQVKKTYSDYEAERN